MADCVEQGAVEVAVAVGEAVAERHLVGFCPGDDTVGFCPAPEEVAFELAGELALVASPPGADDVVEIESLHDRADKRLG